MVAGSILPVTIHQGEILFLFGKECNLEDSAKGWSDFGGGCEDCVDSDSDAVRARKVLRTATREGSEESTGFLGTPIDIMIALRQANGIAGECPKRPRSQHHRTGRMNQTRRAKGGRRGKEKNPSMQSITHHTYTLFFLPIVYDANLPVYYNRFHRLLWGKMDRKTLNDTKLFEKSQMEWFSLDQMRARRSQFRSFYREIVDLILERASHPEFRTFVARTASA